MNFKRAIGAVVCVCFAGLAGAQDFAPPAATRVRMLDFRKAILNCDDGKKAAEELKKRFAAKNAGLDKKEKEIVELQKQLEAMPADDAERRNQMLLLIRKKATEYERDKQDLTEEIQQAEAAVINKIGKRIVDVLGPHAAKRGYDLVLETSNQEIGVLWFPRVLDITDEVIAAVNASGAPPAPDKLKPGQ